MQFSILHNLCSCYCVKRHNSNYFLLSDLDMSAPATPAQPVVSTQTAPEILPSAQTLLQASKLAIEQDRAILLDYYRQSVQGTAFFGEDPETKEKILAKSKEEFTSLIKKMYKINEDYIVLTENSLYIVSCKILKRKVNLASLQDAYENSL